MNKPLHSENTPIQWRARLILGFVALNAFVGAGLLWFGVEKDWRRLTGLPNLMMASAGLDLLMLFLHRQEVTGV
ncbi:MAG: hypothetical protein KJ069_02195 [Anaerolineae bacterium]|nr:hypothetical protein [Anaerolineae bacterium]